MMEVKKTDSVGVIVARFQVPELHKGHRYLIDFVRERHKTVLIVLGVRAGARNKINPLTFSERDIMIRQEYSDAEDIIVRSLSDHPFSHEKWSENLDVVIDGVRLDRDVVLYGSRDSFAPLYSTKRFPLIEVPMVHKDSGSAIRDALEFPHTRDGRAAIIYDVQHSFGKMYATSDLAIICPAENTVLLIEKKSHDGLLSFMGGFADKTDVTGKDVALRERSEEIKNISIGDPCYIEAISINDPRYTGTPDGIMTSFYWASFRGGNPLPDDDADSVHWIKREKLSSVLVPWHQPLGELLNRHWPG